MWVGNYVEIWSYGFEFLSKTSLMCKYSFIDWVEPKKNSFLFLFLLISTLQWVLLSSGVTKVYTKKIDQVD